MAIALRNFAVLIVIIAIFAVYARRWLDGCTCSEVADLTGKVAIVTGATEGIGVETAKALYRMGATVIIPCRNSSKGEQISNLIRNEIVSNGAIEVMALDLSSLASVSGFADKFNSKFKALHILVNNAGVWPHIHRDTSDKLQEIFQVNHLSHFLLVGLLLPRLKAGGTPSHPSRIVTLSSGLHYNGALMWDEIETGRVISSASYDPFKAYSNSKLLNVLFATELQR